MGVIFKLTLHPFGWKWASANSPKKIKRSLCWRICQRICLVYDDCICASESMLDCSLHLALSCTFNRLLQPCVGPAEHSLPRVLLWETIVSPMQEQAPQETASRSRLNVDEGLRNCWRDICNVILLAKSQASSHVIAASYQKLLMQLSGSDSPSQPPSDSANAANDFHEASAEAHDSVRATTQHLHGWQSRQFHQHASQLGSGSSPARTEHYHQPHLSQLPWLAASPTALASDVVNPSQGLESAQWQGQHSSLEEDKAWSMRQPSKLSSTRPGGGDPIDPRLVGILRRAAQDAFDKLVHRGAARAAWTIIEAMRQVCGQVPGCQR